MHRVIDEILQYAKNKERYIIFIDGRSGAGKTTLAGKLQEQLKCPVVHMDDFFLQPHQRTTKRLEEPGGNVDYERVCFEILQPFEKGEDIAYHPYDCKSQTLLETVKIKYEGKLILEGAYSGHPVLWKYADLHVFMDVDKEEQLERLEKRVGKERIVQFKEKWIPLEELYISHYDIDKKCELYFKN